ncbi:unnamed protein product [Lupinus luteus]|uniref:RNase H type-1 domain-containing protein n=1 Tax=Lupinus luteus TaxID=3873 RepID=A0AAV1YBA0_LUPLU
MSITSNIFKAFKEGINISGHNNNSRSASVRWFPSHDGWVKLNSDGAFSSSSVKAACGGVIRDRFGAFLFGYARGLGICSTLHSTQSAYALIRRIKGLMVRDCQFTWNHIFRKGNSVADAFAKFGLSLGTNMRIFDVMSDFYGLHFSFDLVGTVYKRDSHSS